MNYTVFIQNKYYQLEVVHGKASMQLTGLDLGNYTVVAMRDADENFELAMNFTTFSIAKTYSNFLVLSTNVEYDTLNEAVANSNDEDTIYVKNGIYKDTGIVISNKVLDIIALEGAVFDAQGGDANFIIVNETAAVLTFKGATLFMKLQLSISKECPSLNIAAPPFSANVVFVILLSVKLHKVSARYP